MKKQSNGLNDQSKIEVLSAAQLIKLKGGGKIIKHELSGD